MRAKFSKRNWFLHLMRTHSWTEYKFLLNKLPFFWDALSLTFTFICKINIVRRNQNCLKIRRFLLTPIFESSDFFQTRCLTWWRLYRSSISMLYETAPTASAHDKAPLFTRNLVGWPRKGAWLNSHYNFIDYKYSCTQLFISYPQVGFSSYNLT